MARLDDPEDVSGRYRNGGFGCHLQSGVAAIRAICEAVQSRLAFIHGGRDDLAEQVAALEASKEPQANASPEPPGPLSPIDFDCIPDMASEAATIEGFYEFLMQRLRRQGFARVCRVAFTTSDQELQVVKIVVPGLEDLDKFSRRVGTRVLRLLESMVAAEASEATPSCSSTENGSALSSLDLHAFPI